MTTINVEALDQELRATERLGVTLQFTATQWAMIAACLQASIRLSDCPARTRQNMGHLIETIRKQCDPLWGRQTKALLDAANVVQVTLEKN